MAQPNSATHLLGRILAGFLTLLFVALPARAQSETNGLTLDNAPGAGVTGVVNVVGVADHPTFRKWQLDLLLDGGETDFLALGEKPMTAPGLLLALDTRLYPDGPHQLRLRVVHSNLNYDEYFLPIRIANQPGNATSAPLPPQPAPPAAQPAAAPALSGHSLSFVAQDGLLSVRGVADHPTFRKWQIDLLINGDGNQAAFLGVGEERVDSEKELVTFDPADYPAGAHQLRLRVIYGHLDYDEYLLPLTIGTGGIGASPLSATGNSRLVIRGPADSKAIYLTFDDGPDPNNTPQVLALLAEYNAKATFFVVGRHAQNQGDLLQKMYDAGHAIANHSWNHSKLGNADWETFEAEVEATEKVLGSYGSHCLRPPYGDVGKPLYANAKKAGYTLIYWSVDPLDWLYQNPETIASRVLAKTRPGSIVLLHDGGDSRAGTIEALKTILATLSAEGYTFPPLCR